LPCIFVLALFSACTNPLIELFSLAIISTLPPSILSIAVIAFIILFFPVTFTTVFVLVVAISLSILFLFTEIAVSLAFILFCPLLAFTEILFPLFASIAIPWVISILLFPDWLSIFIAELLPLIPYPASTYTILSALIAFKFTWLFSLV